MKAGDLIKHKKVGRTGIIVNIFTFDHRWEKYAKVLFSGELTTSTAPLKILKENWEVISEI